MHFPSKRFDVAASFPYLCIALRIYSWPCQWP